MNPPLKAISQGHMHLLSLSMLFQDGGIARVYGQEVKVAPLLLIFPQNFQNGTPKTIFYLQSHFQK